MNDNAKIYKGTHLSEEVPSLSIEASDEIYWVIKEMDYEQAQQLFSNQAKEIVRRLRASLPGGTIDAILVELLDQKRSQLTVPHTKE